MGGINTVGGARALSTMQSEPVFKTFKMSVYNLSWASGGIGAAWCDAIYVGGFSKAFVLIRPSGNFAGAGNHMVSLKLEQAEWYFDEVAAESFSPDSSWQVLPNAPVTTVSIMDGRVDTTWNPGWSEDSYVGIKAPYMQMLIKGTANTTLGWLNIQVFIYLRND